VREIGTVVTLLWWLEEHVVSWLAINLSVSQ